MAINLLEKIQTNLGYPQLNKIDPNTQEEKPKSDRPNETVEQAAIVTVCVGLYKYSRDPESAANISRGNISSTWLEEIFGDTKRDILKEIAEYSGEMQDKAKEQLQIVTKEALSILREEAGDDPDGSKTRDILSAQRQNMLLYLPPQLHLGEHLNDSTLDDRTNKMEGPMSNLMHSIEQAFTDSRPEK